MVGPRACCTTTARSASATASSSSRRERRRAITVVISSGLGSPAGSSTRVRVGTCRNARAIRWACTGVGANPCDWARATAAGSLDASWNSHQADGSAATSSRGSSGVDQAIRTAGRAQPEMATAVSPQQQQQHEQQLTSTLSRAFTPPRAMESARNRSTTATSAPESTATWRRACSSLSESL